MKRGKYLLTFLFFVFAISFLAVSQQSCAPKYGCEMEAKGKESLSDKMFSSKRGKSSLFPKRMRKKMNK